MGNDRRTALVTGATGGIGGAIARRLCAEGVDVIATGRDAERARAAAAEIASDAAHATATCRGVALDVTDDDSVAALARQLGGGVDWLINNAGVAETAPALSAGNKALLRRLLEVNLFGPVRLFRAFGPGMVERGSGAVVQVASSAALQGYPYVSAYAASKHALLGWTRSAALECAPKGVAVSTVCPHYVDTPLTDRSIQTMREKSGRSEDDLRAFVASQNPGGVIVSPQEVAEATLDLLCGGRGGRVVELPGGGMTVLDEGIQVAAKAAEAT